MNDIGPEDNRLERLRDLSNQITLAMAEMVAFEARVNAALRAIIKAHQAHPPETPTTAPPPTFRRPPVRAGRKGGR